MGNKPDWLKVRASGGEAYHEMLQLVKDKKLHTVCEEAACPNIGECWNKKHATVMILGKICTRACRFCNVQTGKPFPVDLDEPRRLATMVATLKLNHVVITSVDRDDLADGGASQFVNSILEIRKCSNATIEILTPDFLHKGHVIQSIVETNPDIFAHNIETVPRLYSQIRPKAVYFNSLNVLKIVKTINNNIFTKSSIMLGLGETTTEILQVMDDMRSADIDFITLGQYLQPTKKHVEVKEFIHPDQFLFFKNEAIKRGFQMVSSSVFTRSSYHAGQDFKILKENRLQRTSVS